MAVCEICKATFAVTLTPRECQILDMMADALSTRAIGQKLHISEKTVHSYFLIIRIKLDLPDRNHLMRYAIMKRCAEQCQRGDAWQTMQE